jgi:predicted transcriptional regulator
LSAQALIWAANVRGLKPATKIVLIQLSERHNKDTGLCNPSIKTLADDCEMDRTTVMRHIDILEGLGLLTKSANAGEGTGRQSNEYRLHVPEQIRTEAKSDFTTGAKSQSDGGQSRNPTGVKSHSYATQTLREPTEEPSLFGSNEPQRLPLEQDRAEEFWDAYPKCKRKMERADVLIAFRKIVSGKHPKQPKTDAETIIAAVKRFAASGEDPDYMPFPVVWLNKGRWDGYPPPAPTAVVQRWAPGGYVR